MFGWSPEGRGVLLESEEESAGADDEEQGEVEDSLLPGHHHPSVAAERVLAGQLFPFSHLSRDHHCRHVAPSLVPLRINANMTMEAKIRYLKGAISRCGAHSSGEKETSSSLAM